MNILFWVPYTKEGASNRFRVEQYLPYITQNGYQYNLRPFWIRKAFLILYKKGHYLEKICYFFLGIFSRFIDILTISKYDIVFVHREASPFGPPFFEWVIYKFKKPIVFDFDDAIFMHNFNPVNRIYRFLKSPSKTKKIIKMSRAVIVSNNFLKTYACKFNPYVYVIPTAIDTDRFNISKNDSKRIVIGWIGSPTTAIYLDLVFNVMQELGKRYDFILRVVGAERPISIPGVRVEGYNWQLEREVKDFQGLDIGIYPLPDTLWVQGKAAFKAIQYMACAVPAVASPVGMTKEVIQDGVNGFLATSEEEYIGKISNLIEDIRLRREMGLAARKTVEESFSVKVNAPKLLEVLNYIK